MNRGWGNQILRMLAAADERVLLGCLRDHLAGRSAALCFHRIGEPRGKLRMPAEEIDRLIQFVLAAAGGLTVSFDDGYRESAEYVLQRAPEFPQVEWLYFVCPEKLELRAGYRWDVPGSAQDAPVDLAGENRREDLRAAGRDLAGIEEVLRVQRLPNASLGNHTNVHFRPALMREDQFAEECARSKRHFERLFGPQRHFAFPFGVPGVDFGPEHMDELRALGDFLVWSTEPRPFQPRERRPGTPLPRFAVDGSRTWKETAAHIALHAVRTRLLAEAA
jgi:hypothetical protein